MLSQCARFIRRLCFTRRALTVACFLLVAAGVALFYSNWLIVNASQHLTWNDIQTVPARNVGLVLGAKPGNRYFTRRINTAAALYHAGKVKWLLVSGDNGKKEYDEPSAMQQALIAKGVPEAAIFVIMPDSPRWTPWFAPGKCLAKAALRLSRKHFIINGRSGWRNNMALTLSALTRRI